MQRWRESERVTAIAHRRPRAREEEGEGEGEGERARDEGSEGGRTCVCVKEGER